MKRNLIRIIHTGKSHLGWDDATYRDVLLKLTGHRTSVNCSEKELREVITWMRDLGFSPPNSYGQRPRVALGRKGILCKIELLLTEAGLPWSYLDRLIEQMLGEKKPTEWLNDDQIHTLLKMLNSDLRPDEMP